MPEILAVPTTSSFLLGELVPMPTLPELSILSRSELFVLNVKTPLALSLIRPPERCNEVNLLVAPPSAMVASTSAPDWCGNTALVPHCNPELVVSPCM